MKHSGKCNWAGAWTGALLVILGCGAQFPATADDALAWPALTAQNRPWTWWWWHGSAVDETNLAHELQRFHDAGLGGVQFTPIFGVQGRESQDLNYLSPAWLNMMDYTVAEAHRLGMGVDMTLGTGWCFGGPTVSDADANANVVVKTYNVASSGKLPEKIDRKSTQALVAVLPHGQSKDLTKRISAGGAVAWSAPAGGATVYAISQKPSGQKVKRPAPGGEGWMLNPLYPQAMRDWLPWFDKAFAHYLGAKPGAVFQDSYEYRTDWSPDFFTQFEKRQGYKLQTELPALFSNEADDRAARVKYDYRRTVSDVMVEQSEPVWIDWAHKNGFTATYQAHGTPGNWLDLYGVADTPETEMFRNDRSILVSKFASSAAHTQGRILTGAETGTWLAEHFTETLAALKYLADDMFLAGVNHIFYHGTCYSPDDAPWPGWVFYASTEMNPRNAIWHDVPALNEYVARCQSILQSGRPDNDILLYWPIADFWSDPSGRLQAMSVGQRSWLENQAVGKTAHELWNRGYAFDYVSDRQLQQARVVDGEIHMPGGDYQVIVVPECKLMPLETMKELLSLARSGATVIFEKNPPADVPGWDNLDRRRSEFQKLVRQIQFSATGESLLGKGRVLATSLETGLLAANVRRESMVDAGLTFIRRSFDGGVYYFIANRTETNFDGSVALGSAAKSVVVLDPMTGHSGVAATRRSAANLTELRLQLAAGGSVILRVFAGQNVEGTPWNCWEANGLSNEIPLSSAWNVEFVDGGPALPAPFSTPRLASWTVLGGTNAQSFAGTARYTITFGVPDPDAGPRWLDLGDVRQSARVRLNGKDYGTLITPPFAVVVDNLKPSDNHLEVEVTSTSANRIRDLDRRSVPWKIFKDINIVNVNYRPFSAADWPVADCGLLGPVTLTVVTPAK